MLKNFFKFEKWFGVIILAAFMNMALFSYDALCAPALSRDKAATLIQKSLSEVKTKVRLHDSGYQKGLQHDMWVEINKAASLTGKGNRYFQALNYSTDFWGNFAAQASGSGSGSVILKKPVNVRVKVTGIRVGSLAEFTWEYVGLPSVVKRYVVRGGNGTAQFTLYDDGWRLTNVNHKYSNVPATLTAKERAEEEQDFLRFRERELARLEQEHARLEQEKERRERFKRIATELVTKSNTPTKEIASIMLHYPADPVGSPGLPNDRAQVDTILNVSDVGFSWEKEKTYVNSGVKETTSGNVLFGDIYKTGSHQEAPYVASYSGFKPGIKHQGFDLDNIQLKDITDPHGEPTGSFKVGTPRDILLSDNKEDARKAYDTLCSAYKQWIENHKELTKMMEAEPGLFREVAEREKKAKKEAAERAEQEKREKRIKEIFASSDLTGLDNETKLMWTQDANIAGKEMTWNDAFKFVESLNQQKYAGHSDWRLPSREELLTLVEFARRMGFTGNINDFYKNIGFKNVQAKFYWSSTAYASNTTHACYVVMRDGYVNFGPKGDRFSVWPVRAGQ